MKPQLPFIVQWSQGLGDDRLSWWVRGVPPDRYYGEITRYSPRLQQACQGTFDDSDFATMQQLIEEIRRVSGMPAASWHDHSVGLLALGTRAKPEIVLRYSAGAEAIDESAGLFLKIVAILRNYVETPLDKAKSA